MTLRERLQSRSRSRSRPDAPKPDDGGGQDKKAAFRRALHKHKAKSVDLVRRRSKSPVSAMRDRFISLPVELQDRVNGNKPLPGHVSLNVRRKSDAEEADSAKAYASDSELPPPVPPKDHDTPPRRGRVGGLSNAGDNNRWEPFTNPRPAPKAQGQRQTPSPQANQNRQPHGIELARRKKQPPRPTTIDKVPDVLDQHGLEEWLKLEAENEQNEERRRQFKKAQREDRELRKLIKACNSKIRDLMTTLTTDDDESQRARLESDTSELDLARLNTWQLDLLSSDYPLADATTTAANDDMLMNSTSDLVFDQVHVLRKADLLHRASDLSSAQQENLDRIVRLRKQVLKLQLLLGHSRRYAESLAKGEALPEKPHPSGDMAMSRSGTFETLPTIQQELGTEHHRTESESPKELLERILQELLEPASMEDDEENSPSSELEQSSFTDPFRKASVTSTETAASEAARRAQNLAAELHTEEGSGSRSTGQGDENPWATSFLSPPTPAASLTSQDKPILDDAAPPVPPIPPQHLHRQSSAIDPALAHRESSFASMARPKLAPSMSSKTSVRPERFIPTPSSAVRHSIAFAPQRDQRKATDHSNKPKRMSFSDVYSSLHIDPSPPLSPFSHPATKVRSLSDGEMSARRPVSLSDRSSSVSSPSTNSYFDDVPSAITSRSSYNYSIAKPTSDEQFRHNPGSNNVGDTGKPRTVPAKYTLFPSTESAPNFAPPLKLLQSSTVAEAPRGFSINPFGTGLKSGWLPDNDEETVSTRKRFSQALVKGIATPKTALSHLRHNRSSTSCF